MSRGWRNVKALALVAALVLTGGIATAIDLTDNGGRYAEANGFIPTPGNTRFLNSMAGDNYANVMGSSISVQREFRRALPSIYSYSQTAHYQNRADAAVSSGDALANVETTAIDATNYYVVCPTTMCSPGSKWVMWDVPFMTNETQKMDDGYLGYRQTTSGFATGISRMLGETSAIGLAVGYDGRKMKGRDGYHSKNNADTFHAALYGGTNIGHFFIDGYAGFSRSWNRSERDIYNGPAAIQRNKANYNDTVLSAGLKVSYVWILPSDVRITPSVGADFSHVRSGSFREKSNQAAAPLLRADSSSYSTLAVPIMVSANKTFSSCFLAFGGHNSLWTPEVRGGYVPQFGSKRADVDMQVIGTNNKYNAKSAKFTGSYGTAGAGMKLKLRDKYIFAVDYDFIFGSNYTNHSLTAMYGVSF